MQKSGGRLGGESEREGIERGKNLILVGSKSAPT